MRTEPPTPRAAEAVILGVDPGSLFTGYGIVRAMGGSLTLVCADRLALDPDWPMASRLVAIHERMTELVELHRPTAMAIEDLFTFKNARSALKLAHARAAALLAGTQAGLPVFEYSPSLVKKTVAGGGRADKAQVAFMVGRILNLDDSLPPDASDALAVAICHAGQNNHAAGALATGAAGRARASSWRRLSAQDLAALGYRVERTT